MFTKSDAQRDAEVGFEDDLCRHRSSGQALNHAQFCDSLLELVDVWCEHIESIDLYCEILAMLHETMSSDGRELNADALKEFKRADRDNSGSLDATETRFLVEEMGFPAGDDFGWLFSKFDADNSGGITQDEFEALQQYVKARATFVKFDKNRDGTLDRSEVPKLLRRLGRKCSEDDIDAIFAEFDVDHDGDIGLNEFMKLYESTSGDRGE